MFKNFRQRRISLGLKKSGFTLIEMLMVISLVSLLASIVVVAVGNATDKAKIASTQQFAASVSGQLRDNIVAIWTFNDTTNLGKDSWEGKNNGTLGNGTCTPGNGSCPTVVSGGGISGNALSFDGGDYVKTTLKNQVNNLDAVSGNTWTTSAWFKQSAINASDGVVTGLSGGTGSSATYAVYLNSGTLYAKFKGGTTPNNIKSGVSDNKWHLIIIAWDGLNMKGYFDGKLYNLTVTGSALKQDYYFTIGATASGASNFFTGEIDEVQVFNAALTAQEVQKLYAESALRHGIAIK